MTLRDSKIQSILLRIAPTNKRILKMCKCEDLRANSAVLRWSRVPVFRAPFDLHVGTIVSGTALIFPTYKTEYIR